ncbi:hypothetical protein A3D00_04805 [Candidatus Woesebacteria bacterium RIFCSPHIGHO2_02_FULL_38_9]|uniref:Uncharacterized protein n=1 Tax=Candidatus Woesebacteria bacterium RIFCSPHIGHO2_01_FULL_39_28 TaxID=1802496 RepID=A0A1F7YC78_9BACT|nr:MAG: hypothetical protein A2627_02955 [Candidatus Woesebacteria bacterium RIFCSPHIGHO2_01_FULL_39_28]OGM34426.1 MAG: hypothetical protein A3D00_04805 [Candidatus Woesebacteria bacterium RIFCSPHIGHO2_02_FULL_38_9]OGM58006.1 MAG: hypothetical protein A3A50_01965 [Candidatus Woesebacteria bacterium RIFCSPLOWO2_01_FULL_38_20]
MANCGAAACISGCGLEQYLESPSTKDPSEKALMFEMMSPICLFARQLEETYMEVLQQSKIALAKERGG